MKKQIEKACAGDPAAARLVLDRLAPEFELWATKRMPREAAATIAPAVRNGLQKALSNLKQATRRGEGAFLVEARAAILQELAGSLGDMTQSQLVRSVGQRPLESYERALNQLDATSREALVLRVELGYAFDRIAAAIGVASSDEARSIVSRSLLGMSELMEAP